MLVGNMPGCLPAAGVAGVVAGIVASSIAAGVAAGITAGVAAFVAGVVAQAYIVVVAQRRGREKRQREKFVTYVLREFFAGRDGAEAIGGNQDFHLSQHLQDNRHAYRQLELVVAFIGTGHANGADHALQAVGHDGFVGDGQKDVFIHPPTAATPLYTATQNLLASSLPADTIEQRLKYARLHAGLSGEALASLMGINKDSYWKMEARCHSMSCQHFLSFCRATACDPSFVLYGPLSPPVVPLVGDTIGARLAFFRASTGLTLRAFNVKCGFAARNSSASAWENGRYLPQLSSLLTIASAFGINAVSFLP